jgi:hypothetical protein
MYDPLLGSVAKAFVDQAEVEAGALCFFDCGHGCGKEDEAGLQA